MEQNSISQGQGNRCRACMTEGLPEKMTSLLDSHNLELFSKCTALEINLLDDLPKCVCLNCFLELENVQRFQQKCWMSESHFKSELFERDLLIKLEPMELADVKEETFLHDGTMNLAQHDRMKDQVKTDFSTISNDDYICDICKGHFENKSKLCSHMTAHVNDQYTSKSKSQRVRRKSGTSRVLKRNANKVHQKVDSDRSSQSQNGTVKRKKIFCLQCPKWFSIQEKLDGHLRRDHEGLKGYKCENEMCGKEFNKLRTYRLHVDTFHSANEVPKFECGYDGCDKVYHLKESLRSHIKVFHLKMAVIKTDKHLICETCGKSFRNVHSLKVHGYSHTGNFPFACSRCPRKLESSYKLKIHIMKHLNIKNFICPHCGLRKTTNRELKDHLNVHSDEKKFQCKECTQAFNTYSSLNNHIRIHHKKSKPYVCSYCQRTFAKKGTMKNHVMTHTGEKPYTCSICGHKFIQAVSLRLHLKVHSKQQQSTTAKGNC